jgi:hypothetical protein
MRSSRERVRCSCLKVAHLRELRSSLKNKNQDWSLRESGERELKLWISKKLFDF